MACAATSRPAAESTSRIDGGKTWAFAGLRDGGQTGAIRIHPSNPDIVIAAMTGDIFKANAERGIFKTVDGGKTWKKTLYLTEQVGAMDVEFQPGNPAVVYAWMSRLERKPWTIISGGRSKAPASTRAPTAATRSPRSRPACRAN